MVQLGEIPSRVTTRVTKKNSKKGNIGDCSKTEGKKSVGAPRIECGIRIGDGYPNCSLLSQLTYSSLNYGVISETKEDGFPRPMMALQFRSCDAATMGP